MQSTDPHSHHSDARPDDQAGDQHAQQPGAPNAGQQGRGQPDPGQQGTGHQGTGHQDTGHQDTGATAAIIALEREVALLREERLRERADLENQRRRMVRDVEQARRFANERLLGDLLPVFDSLERGLEAAGTDANAASMREGVELTLRQLLKVAGDNGLQPVDPQGQAFDPERHQAMSTAESTDVPPGQVVQVFQKGYTLNERLLRPALVVVAKAPGD